MSPRPSPRVPRSQVPTHASQCPRPLVPVPLLYTAHNTVPIIQDIGKFDNSNYLSSKQELQDQRRDYIILFSCRVLVEYNTSLAWSQVNVWYLMITSPSSRLKRNGKSFRNYQFTSNAVCDKCRLQTCRPADLQTCRLADLQTCRLADLQTCRLQTCRLADSTYWPFPIHFKNNIV